MSTIGEAHSTVRAAAKTVGKSIFEHRSATATPER